MTKQEESEQIRDKIGKALGAECINSYGFVDANRSFYQYVFRFGEKDIVVKITDKW